MESAAAVRVLLVDDDPACADALGRLLRAHGFEVTIANDPEDAEVLIAEKHFDVLLSDVRMPGNANLGWIRRVLERVRPFRVVLLTGAPELPTAIAAANLPIAAYLLKPPEPEKLAQTLRDAAAAARQQAAVGAIAAELSRMQHNLDELPDGPAITTLLRRAAEVLTTEQVRLVPGTATPRPAEWLPVVREAIAVLEQTKQNFRSKELGALRLRLRELVCANSPAQAPQAVSNTV